MATGPDADASASGPVASGLLFPSFCVPGAGARPALSVISPGLLHWALFRCSDTALIPNIERNSEQQHETLNGLLVVDTHTHQ